MKLKTPLLVFIALLSLFLVSCEKYEDLDDKDETENFIGSFFDDDRDDNNLDDDDEDLDELCFDFVFPVSLDFPGGDVVTFDSLVNLWTTVVAWYDSAPEADSLDPMVVFPVNVTLGNGEVISVMDDEKLSYLLDDCEDDYEDYEDHGDNECDEYLDWITDDLADCYGIIYPLQVAVGDDSITISTEMDIDSVFVRIADLLEDNEDLDVNLVYPVTVVDSSTNANIVIESDAQLAELAITCEVSNLCFSINYPITLVSVDGGSQNITNDVELIAAYIQFEIDDQEGELIPVFPVTVTLDNGDVLTKENLQDFEELYDYCD